MVWSRLCLSKRSREVGSSDTIEPWPPLLSRSSLRNEVVDVAQALLGVELHSFTESGHSAGRIVETEAYRGADDRAAHSFGHRRTPRTEVFFGDAGHAYVYFVYGIHTMFNVVVGPVGSPEAVLIRALEPIYGLELMCSRRVSKTGFRQNLPVYRLANGPGLVCQALGIKREDYGVDLLDAKSPLQLRGELNTLTASEIIASPRVGVAYAGECAAWPWRFRQAGSVYSSPAK